MQGEAIYRALCLTLSGRRDRVHWTGFTAEEWRRFVERAASEGVAPLAYWHLRRAGRPEPMPASALETLGADCRRVATLNALRMRELGRILEALGRERVPVLVLKGAALASTVYANPALRPMVDIDLLVRQDDLGRAVQAAQGLGFEVGHTLHLSPGISQAAPYHVTLRHAHYRGVILELHWRLLAGEADWRSPSLEWFWEQAKPLPSLSGTAAGPDSADDEPSSGQPRAGRAGSSRTLTAAAHFLYLAAHLTLQHGGGRARLLWYYDLHLLMEAGDLDWDLLLAQARALAWQAAVAAAVRETAERFGTPVPPVVLEWMARPAGGRVERLVRQRAARPRSRTDVAWSLLRSLSWPGRWRFLSGVLVPKPSYMRAAYAPRPAWLWPLTYVPRWLDILGDGLATVIRHKRKQEKSTS